MNENTINVNMENLSTEERTQLLALIEKANKPQESGLWKPEKHEEYYFIYADGDIAEVKNEDCTADRKIFALGNYFRTKEEAEFMVERLKVLHELRELAGGYKFQLDEDNYFLFYDFIEGKIGTIFNCCSTYGTEILFPTQETAQNAIGAIGEYRLKKYYFCIED